MNPTWRLRAAAFGLGVGVLATVVAAVGLSRSSFLPDVTPAAQVEPLRVAAAPVGSAVPAPGAGEGAAPPAPAAAWTARVAVATGIPVEAVRAYGAAALAVAAGDPACHLGWTTLAGIGEVESDHGRYGGSAIDPDGVDRPTILGPALDGTNGNKALPDTDGGRLDGDAVWDRAVGPLQFIPTTWATWGRSATGSTPDPNDIDDAALTAATYLCAAGADMGTPSGWRTAIGSYNEPVEYAVAVADAANGYVELSS